MQLRNEKKRLVNRACKYSTNSMCCCHCVGMWFLLDLFWYYKSFDPLCIIKEKIIISSLHTKHNFLLLHPFHSFSEESNSNSLPSTMNRFTILSILCLLTIASLIQNTIGVNVPSPPPSSDVSGLEVVPTGNLDEDEVDVSSRSASKANRDVVIHESQETKAETLRVVGKDDEDQRLVKLETSTKTSLNTSNRLACSTIFGWATSFTRCYSFPSTVWHARYRTLNGYFCGSGRVYLSGTRICVKPGCRAFIYYFRA